MPDYTLSVPLVGQKTTSDAKPLKILDASGHYVTHGFMACWYASACMVSYFFHAGPRLGLPDIWMADAGLSVDDLPKLAKAEGLLAIPMPPGALTPATIYVSLTLFGPIWAAGRYLDGSPTAGHAVVITGVKGNEILYNDPWEPQKKSKPAAWFDANLIRVPYTMLIKDRSRS
jgi:hypothetical protein